MLIDYVSWTTVKIIVAVAILAIMILATISESEAYETANDNLEEETAKEPEHIPDSIKKINTDLNLDKESIDIARLLIGGYENKETKFFVIGTLPKMFRVRRRRR